MCTGYSHYIYNKGNCLCGAWKDGAYDSNRAPQLREEMKKTIAEMIEKAKKEQAGE